VPALPPHALCLSTSWCRLLGEPAVGNLPKRRQTLSDLRLLQRFAQPPDDEIIA